MQLEASTGRKFDENYVYHLTIAWKYAAIKSYTAHIDKRGRRLVRNMERKKLTIVRTRRGSSGHKEGETGTTP